MITTPAFPGIGFERLGPDLDPDAKALWAQRLSMFMHYEVRSFYEDLGRNFIDTDPPPGTPGDEQWRIEAMSGYNTPQEDNTYTEYVVAYEHDEDLQISEGPFAISGIVVVQKPEGRCTRWRHRPSYLAEIDVAEHMRGTGLAPFLLSLTTETHPQDPEIHLGLYRHNIQSRKIHEGKLGFTPYKPPRFRPGEVYEGEWEMLHTSGKKFLQRLPRLLPPNSSVPTTWR